MTIRETLVTHGHIDHCGGTGILAEQLGVPIEGPHPEDIFWITGSAMMAAATGVVDRSNPTAGLTTATR